MTDPRNDRLRAALAGRYVIERELGHGGMATVYLATDLRHERKVALKVFRADLAVSLGPERFLREIRIAANLQHPHILPVHDSGEADGFLFYVMPYVEGESLRDKLAKEGELPIGDAVRILGDVAEALAAAHAKGIVHRDIKPENVMLAGRNAMVADFGVAKALSVSTGHQGLTSAGVALGTPAYMAPEQAAADPHTDKRADLYAFGVTAYEILAGRPPFMGTTPQQILASHMNEAPVPIAVRRATIPPALAQLVMKCLEKKPADRPQSAEELLPVLEALATPSGGMTPPATAPVRGRTIALLFARRHWLAVVGAVAAVAVMIFVAYALARGRASEPVVADFRQLTFSGDVEFSAISGDGKTIAFITARGADDSARLFVQDIAGGRALEVAKVRAPRYLTWFPDGSRIVVSASHQGLHALLFPRMGGVPQVLGRGGYAQVSRDGAQVAIANQVSRRVYFEKPQSGDTNSVRVPGTDQFLLGLALGTDFLAVLTTPGTDNTFFWTVSLRGADTALVGRDSVPVTSMQWAPSGDAIYYVAHNALWRMPVSARTGQRTGPLQALLRDFRVRSSDVNQISVSQSGMDLAYTRSLGQANIWVGDAASTLSHPPAPLRQITSGTAEKRCVDFSPDGSRIAFLQQAGDGRFDVYTSAVDGGALNQVTFSGGAVACPVWSDDGKLLAYLTAVAGEHRIATVAATGGTPRVFASAAGQDVAWAREGRIAYQLPGNHDFVLLDPATGAERRLLGADTLGWVFNPRFSPDGKWVAIEWNRLRGLQETWLISLRDHSQRQVMGLTVSSGPIGWSSDGSALFVIGTDNVIRRLSVANGVSSVAASAPPGLDCGVRDRSGGLLLACMISQHSTDVWVVRHFDPAVRTQER